MPAPDLDFVVIGVPKAGTTSLHEYLRTHPELFLPEVKELQFFTSDSAYDAGWDAFAAMAFRGARPGQLAGKATPQYLGGPASWRGKGSPADASVNEIAASRIAQMFPRVKLVVLLRDPVERAISSYWQAVVLGDERRTIDSALEAELSPESLDAARRYPENDSQYVALGEYGRLLSGYLEHFPREQLFVGSTSRLGSDPQALLDELWLFLGVDPAHRPPNLGQRYQVRGTSRRSRSLSALPRLLSIPGLRRAWEALPTAPRDAARVRLRKYAQRTDQRSRRTDPELSGRPSPELLTRLRRFYEPDLLELERLVGPVEGVTLTRGS